MILANDNFTITYHDKIEKDKIELLLQNIFNSQPYLSCSTSGSTGEPKNIKHSKSSLSISANKTISYFDLKENDSAALCLSVDYIAGIMMVIRAVIAGMHLHVYQVSKQAIDTINEQIDFIAIINIKGIDTVGLMNKVTQIISNQMNVNIKSINIKSDDGIFEGIITLKVHNVSFLQELTKKLERVKAISSITRTYKHQ